MKRLMYASALALISVAFAPTAQAAGIAGNTRVPHVVSATGSMNNGRFQPKSYALKLHVIGRALSALAIDVPEQLRLSQQITVKDQAGKPLDATVIMNGQKAMIAFAQPIEPDTTIQINMDNARALTDDRIWLFGLESRLVGLSADIPLGVIRIDDFGTRF